MGRQKYSQVPANEDQDENNIECTQISQSQLVTSNDDNILPNEFDDEVENDDSDYYDSDNSGSDDYGSDGNYGENQNNERTITAGHSGIIMELIEEQLLWNVFNRWEEPIFLSLVVTTFVLIPTLSLWIFGTYQSVGKWWSIWILIMHLQIRLSISAWYIKSASTVSFAYRRPLRLLCSAATIFEVAMCGFVYPKVCRTLTESFFRDIDGTIVIEWRKESRFMLTGVLMGWLVVILRCCTGLPCLAIRTMKYVYPNLYREWRPILWTPLGKEGSLSDGARNKLFSTFRFLNFFVFGVNLICILSLISHFGPWPSGISLPENCDVLDDTECALPFPSFHHMIPDTSTPTGWRVDLKGMPPLRGGIPLHPKFVSELDGFSTMGPILFYMEGLKEAYENGDNSHGLQGPEHISDSVTPKSITFLIDVNEKTLIPHSAEIDYLDPKNPLVMIFPAEPLKHNNHYALSVISATDENGRKLPRTNGMMEVMEATNSKTRARFVVEVIPAIEEAATWFSFKDQPESLQLLFDFVTVSEEYQLGPIRAARDIALEHVDKWNWDDHVRVASIVDENCSGDNPSITARTVHLSLDVPSFLLHESRYSFLDHNKIERRDHVTVGEAKAIVRIPCSLMQQALGKISGKELRAVVEIGHGLFGNRGEVKDDFYQKMANDNGYIMMAMDWRGMSSYDLPVVIKTLIGEPTLFQAVRDNLIQGFANKFCLQHFSQNGMLDLDVFKFDGQSIPTLNGDPPTSAFYGISQGGILGGGYMSLAGKTKLIERGILGVGGTPMALVMTRSLMFDSYDKLLLLNFYNNRHVRIMLALTQMAWDSTEASGLQARPVSEPIPPLLLQAGLGDCIVPTAATESLARAMGASTLPGNPRNIFGVPVEDGAKNEGPGPAVILSELMYEQEYNSLPIENKDAEPNDVHWCLRLDSAIIEQVEEFINTGHVIDLCRNDQCERTSATC